MTKTALFILCPSHSGSTLLGHFLGAHERILHFGEVVAPIKREAPFACLVCEGAACPVWGTALHGEFVRSCVAQYERSRHLPGILLDAAARVGWRDRRAAVHRRLLDSRPEVDVVVDSSKRLGWALWNRSGRDELRVAFLHLQRDLRGVVASHLDRGSVHSLSRIAREVDRQTRRTLDVMARVDPREAFTLRYEDLVESPAAAGEKLCEFLGLEFQSRMVDYYRFPQHVIGGNAGPTFQVRSHLGRRRQEFEYLNLTSEANQHFYRSGGPGFRHDLRWKERLTPALLDEFERCAGATNRRLGYSTDA